MCIAAVIFSPISLTFLRAMDEDNPHGGGVAWEQDGQIRFVKGLDAQQIYDMQTDKVMSYPYLLHFRWATHGEHVAALTHPFPLGPRALLGEVDGLADKVLIHNGTWHYYESRIARHVSEGFYELPEELLVSGSDTALAAYLAHFNQSVLDDVVWATALAEMRDTVDTDGNARRSMEITTRGQWYDKDGNWYSNLNWVPGEKFDYYGGGWERWRGWESDYTTSSSYKQPSHCGYDDDEYMPPPAPSRSDYDHIKPYLEAVAPNFEGEDRSALHEYVGVASTLKVVRGFYDEWTSTKDTYKPDSVSWDDWYQRFWGPWPKDAKYALTERIKLDEGEGTNTAPKQVEDKAPSLKYEDFVKKYNRAASAKDPTDLSTSPHEVANARKSWNDYLVAKYGPEIAREIYATIPADAASAEQEAETKADNEVSELSLDYDPEHKNRTEQDPDWLSDGDLITDNPSMVNAWLAAKMIG